MSAKSALHYLNAEWMMDFNEDIFDKLGITVKQGVLDREAIAEMWKTVRVG